MGMGRRPPPLLLLLFPLHAASDATTPLPSPDGPIRPPSMMSAGMQSPKPITPRPARTAAAALPVTRAPVGEE